MQEGVEVEVLENIHVAIARVCKIHATLIVELSCVRKVLVMGGEGKGLTPELSKPRLPPCKGSDCWETTLVFAVGAGGWPFVTGWTAPFWKLFGWTGVIGVAGVGVAPALSASADGVAPALRAAVDPFFVARCHQCQHFYKKNPLNAIEYTFALLSLDSAFFFGLVLLVWDGVGGAGVC